MTVDCNTIEERLAAGETPDSAEESAHVRGCALCRELVADGADVGAQVRHTAAPSDVDIDALGAALGRRVDAERGVVAWLRSRRTGLRMVLAALAAAVVTFGTLLAAPRADLEIYPPLRMALAVTSLTLLMLAVGAIVLRPLHRAPLPFWLVATLGGLAAGLPWVLAMLPPAHLAHPAALRGTGAELVPLALGCMTIGTLLGAPLLLLLRALDRGAHGGLARALLAATVAGVLGNLALQMHCPITAPAHLLAGHASVIVLFLAFYAGLRSLRR